MAMFIPVSDDMIDAKLTTFAPTGPGIDNSENGFEIIHIIEYSIFLKNQTVKITTKDNKQTYLDFKDYRITFNTNDPYNGILNLIIGVICFILLN